MTTEQRGAFVLSLDFELLWGVRDHKTIDSYGRNILGGRDAIPLILGRLHDNQMACTWATVGCVFAASRDELMSFLPASPPTYARPELSNYSYLDELGRDERADPYHFGASLVTQISACPLQEIATHTFSHFYCLEAGATPEQFHADLASAKAIAETRNVRLKSIVFPRNQYSDRHLEICAEEGLQAFRGNETAWAYRPAESRRAGSALRRGARLLDSYLTVTGENTTPVPGPDACGMVNVPSSRFLRPYSTSLALAEPFRISRILRGVRHAARNGRIFHLWWHPHNFGRNLDANMRVLDTIIDEYRRLRDAFGMESRTMASFASDEPA